MIRHRLPLKDDSFICNLVIQELLPRSYKVRIPSFVINKSEVNRDVRKRLHYGTTFVASHPHDNLCGFIHVIKKRDTLYIDMLAVDDSQQGKGWGAELLRTGEQYGRNRGLRSAALYVDLLNENAQRFYTRKGYQLQQFHPKVQCYLLTKPL